ncbi:MAG: ABC transporter ATP-binding protein [Lachnospiraceae bacterium]|uniref:ABC transporter ATP-binding protein n=1 Tax=uncultured Acetatifactor sp. TaxID=1671927 RepID=UPI002634DC4E|nr:ABC transporter ATP-binding protein [uncultured Acetatifactor sp.]MCI8789192.1 ABC transporter ATP-binding protein [Lachnospiraceae bacterium]
MEKRNRWKDAAGLIADSFRMSKANYVTLTVSAIIESAKSILEMMAPAMLVDRITGAGAFGPVLGIVFFYALAVLLADASRKAVSLFSTAFGYKAGNRAALSVGQKGMRIDYGGWEDTETYEGMLRAARSTWVFQNITDLLCENWLASVIALVPVLYILSHVDAFLLLPLSALLLLELFLERKTDDRIYSLEEGRAADEKKLHYNEKVMTDLKYGKEIRLYGAMQAVAEKYEESRRKVFSFQRRQKKAEVQFRVCAAAIACVEGILVYLAAIREYGRGAVTLSFFLMFVGAVRLFTESVKSIVENFEWVRDLAGYYSDYRKFMDGPEGFLAAGQKDEALSGSFDIEFRNVSFRYPGTDEYVLKNVNLTFPYGKKTAIVGENGAGKTTLVKLLLRLYDVTEGEILAGGVNIKEIRYQDYLGLYAAVFQDYKLHSFSIRENIAFQEEGKDGQIWELLKKQGLYEAVKETKRGLDTFLTRELDQDGKDFSGGEKQRLAMVRALYRNAPFLVLDEPTAAIDPIAELKYFERLKEDTAGRTAVFVTHRMASTKFADNIVVLERGEVVESGDFAALVGSGGLFEKLFQIQADFYK